MGTTANVLVGDVTITIDKIGAEDPGGLEGASLLPITDVYTMEGVTMTIRSETTDIKVEENVGTIIRKLVDQSVEVTLNFAEGSLANFVAAVPGSSINVGGDTVTIGGGTLQGFSMVLVGEAPSSGTRTITLTRVQPTGEVGIPFKKGAVSVIPVTFSCIVSDLGVFGTVVDS